MTTQGNDRPRLHAATPSSRLRFAMTSRQALTGFLLAGLLSGITGCAKDNPQSTSANSAPTQGGGTEKRLQIAVIPKGTTLSYWQTVKAGADQAGKEMHADIIFQGPTEETDTVGQKNIIEAQISKKVDAIVMAACDANALVPTVKKAQDAGIPVITIDSGLDPSQDTSVQFIATNNKNGGAAGADALAKLIGPEGGDVGMVSINKGAGSSDDREQGFKDELAKYPKMRLVSTLYSQSDVNKGQEAVNAMVTANPNLKGIFGCSEPGGIGGAQALKQKGLAGKVKLVAYDAGKEEIDALQAGTIQALIVQRPFDMGYKGVKGAIEAIKAKKVRADKPEMVDTGVTTVTMENFSQPDIQKVLYPLGPGK